MIPTNGLSILNCAAGDITVTFDSDDPIELARAQRIVEDMLHRGYLLFIQEGDQLKRVRRFNKKHNSYVIADGAIDESDSGKATKTKRTTPATSSSSRKKKTKEREVPAKGTKAVAVARTAGG